MEAECRKKIEELHVFITSWLNGTVKQSEQEFQYFEDELNDNFVIIHPGGDLQAKSDIVRDFRNAYGVLPKNFAIEIRNVKLRSKTKDLCIMNYEEWQFNEETSCRISSVVFKKSQSGDDYTWLHLHETWMPNP